MSVEYGIESCNNKTLEQINRGHSFEKSVWAIEETSRRGLNVGGHFILGLPSENQKNLIAHIDLINKLPLTTVKFHQLQIVNNTAMAQQYASNPDNFKFFTEKFFVSLFNHV